MNNSEVLNFIINLICIALGVLIVIFASVRIAKMEEKKNKS